MYFHYVVALNLNKFESSSPKVSSLVKIGVVVLEMKMWKVLDNDNNDGQGTNCDQKNSVETSAPVS